MWVHCMYVRLEGAGVVCEYVRMEGVGVSVCEG